MSSFVIGIPAVVGVFCFFLSNHGLRRLLMVLACFSHSLLVLQLWNTDLTPASDAWLGLDSLGLLFLTIMSLLFSLASVYSIGYLEREQIRISRENQKTLFLKNNPETIFAGCFLLFLAAMSLVTMARHFGVLWFSLEATTLASAPLVYFHRNHRSLEAMWKYLLVCSLGIALALMGTFFLAASVGSEGGASSLLLGELLENPPVLNSWLRMAFIFMLVGYGTKMGLAPLHTWLPDAHSEAPSVVSVLLSGALLNCAFLGILRAHQVCLAAGEGVFSAGLLVFFGLFSIGVAAVFIVKQHDFKRMLAYSSVENMGIVALGVGLGGAGVFASMFHALNHSLTKALLFMAAGNILSLYASKNPNEIRGVLRTAPVTASVWILGFFAIAGVPPFSVFLSKFLVLKAAFDNGHYWIASAFLLFLAVVFCGMGAIVFRMCQGEPSEALTEARLETYLKRGRREPLLAIAPPVVLLVCLVALGLMLPENLRLLLENAATLLGGDV